MKARKRIRKLKHHPRFRLWLNVAFCVASLFFAFMLANTARIIFLNWIIRTGAVATTTNVALEIFNP